MKRPRGMTMLEVVIASVVLVAMIAMAMMVLFHGSDAAQRGRMEGDLEQRGRQTLARIRAEVQFAKIETTFSSNNPEFHCQISFQKPVDLDGNGYTFDALGNAEWGIDRQNEADVQGYYYLRFEAAEIIRETAGPAVPAPSATNAPFTTPMIPAGLPDRIESADLNFDGDTADTFVRGKLVLYEAPIVAGVRTIDLARSGPFDDDVILRYVPATSPAQLDGDFDGTYNGDWAGNTAAADALFALLDAEGDLEGSGALYATPARALRVRLWHSIFMPERPRLFKVQNEEKINLVNPQS